ncbi:MAG TPA: hypothetical protein VF912_17270 [Anaeromyxobacter sp.]
MRPDLVLMRGCGTPAASLVRLSLSSSHDSFRPDGSADVIGRWARAAHRILAHERWEGLPYPSHRRVTPRGPAARPLPGPTLVEILVHEWRLV